MSAIASTSVSLAPVSRLEKNSRSIDAGVIPKGKLLLSWSGLHKGDKLCVKTSSSSSRVQSSKPFRLNILCVDLEQQFKEIRLAEKRWETQIAEGKFKSLTAKEAGYAVKLSGNALLDVRPSYERNKAYVKESVWVPFFEVDRRVHPGILLDKLTFFSMGGWWAGGDLTRRNERFMPDIVSKFPDKSTPIIVSCQKGLRSLAACEQLYKAGYRNLFWLNGGYDTTEDGDFESEGPYPLRMAGIGGVSEFLGWTDVQRAQAAREGIGYRLTLLARLAALFIGIDLLFVGGQQVLSLLQH